MFQGKTVVITGSTKGIGYAIAQVFAKEGANIVLNGRKSMDEAAMNALKELGANVHFVAADVQYYEDAKKLLTEAKETFGSVDVLVNNAGITCDKLLMRMTPEEFAKVININLTGTFNTTQVVSNIMLKQRSGTIINLASVSGLIGNAGQANYAASKAGVVGLTKATARELAARGITCNAIAPGFIQTDMTDVLSERVQEAAKQQIPLKRFGTVEDVANTALFLASSPYITGQVLNVDGGMVMHG